ncbi:hypothetical protein VTP01DRAFT_4967 [Rhizomucor pusillus]|uniref:uncharacterized protein n=1 Tax=Rhizomucor pusillus TaxID=4840 RepID=UPI003742DC60
MPSTGLGGTWAKFIHSAETCTFCVRVILQMYPVGASRRVVIFNLKRRPTTSSIRTSTSFIPISSTKHILQSFWKL